MLCCAHEYMNSLMANTNLCVLLIPRLRTCLHSPLDFYGPHNKTRTTQQLRGAKVYVSVTCTSHMYTQQFRKVLGEWRIASQKRRYSWKFTFNNWDKLVQFPWSVFQALTLAHLFGKRLTCRWLTLKSGFRLLLSITREVVFTWHSPSP